MGIFDDKKFDELDWISQATEPIDSQMNEILAKIPDVVEIDFALFKKITTDSYSLDISISTVVRYFANKFCPGHNMGYQQLNALEKCFKFELSSDEIILNFAEQTMSGEIVLIKAATTMDEKVLENLLGVEGIESLSYHDMARDTNVSRMNEILELLGKCDEGLRTRSARKKFQAIQRRLKSLFKTNEWKIKDTELANKVSFWIRDYVTDGNLAAFSNFCRLKVMTHKDQPIYSMEEVS
jgi:hypothetical protein